MHGRLVRERVAEVEAAAARGHRGRRRPAAERARVAAPAARRRGPDRNLLLRAAATARSPATPTSTPPTRSPGPSAETGGRPRAPRARVRAAARRRRRWTPPAGHRLRLWAHGDHPAARALAAHDGLHARSRRLRQWRRRCACRCPTPRCRAGVRLRTFRPGRGRRGLAGAQRRGLRAPPGAGRVDADDLDDRMAEPWFDPAGFLLAERTADGRRAGRLPLDQGPPGRQARTGTGTSRSARSTSSASTRPRRAAASAGR